MEFEEKFLHNKTLLSSYDDVFACVHKCNTLFSPLLTQNETQCLSITH